MASLQTNRRAIGNSKKVAAPAPFGAELNTPANKSS
jgi:hypothetical protein